MTDQPDPLDMPRSVEMFNVEPGYFENQQVRALTDDEINWLDNCKNAGKQLLAHYKLSSDGGFSLIMLDQALQCWRSDTAANKPDDEFVSKAVGSLFAFFLRHAFKGTFVIVTDQYGSDLGVQTAPGEIGYPIDSVRKRLYEPQATLVDLVATVAQHLNQSSGQ